MNITIPREDRFFAYGLTADSLPSKPLVFQLDGDAYYECTGIHFHTGQASFTSQFNNYTILLRELGSAAQGFMNTAVFPSLFCGTGGNAKHFRTPILFAPNSMVQVDVSAAPTAPPLINATNIDIALLGVKRYQMTSQEYAQRRQRPFFVYATPIIQTFPNLQYIQIATDADFVVQNIGGYGDVGNTTAGSNMDFRSATIQITDESSQKSIFENAMPWSQICGQSDVWRGNNRLQSPLIFRRTALISIDFGGTVKTNLDIQFGFEGYKIKD